MKQRDRAAEAQHSVQQKPQCRGSQRSNIRHSESSGSTFLEPSLVPSSRSNAFASHCLLRRWWATQPFGLWFNCLSGSAYVIAEVGIAIRKPRAGQLSRALALTIMVVFALLDPHVLRGGKSKRTQLPRSTFARRFGSILITTRRMPTKPRGFVHRPDRSLRR